MAKRKKNKYGPRERALRMLCAVGGAVFLLMLSVTVYAEYLLGKVNFRGENPGDPMTLEEALDYLARETDPAEDYTGPHTDAESVELGKAEQLLPRAEGTVNILLVGADYQSGDRARSDAMILCTFHPEKNTVTLTSLLRDMYVQIPGYYKNRINASYAIGGMELLEKTLVYNFGLQPDGIVEVDFSRFRDVVDLLGGVEITLTAAEAAFINEKNRDNLTAGTHRLDGNQALWYARFRGDSSGDFGRTNRQRTLLSKLAEGYRNAGLRDLLAMAEEILPMVTTNLTKNELLRMGRELFPMLSGAEIVTQRIPAEGGYYMTRIDGMSVLVPDMEFNMEILKDTLSE